MVGQIFVALVGHYTSINNCLQFQGGIWADEKGGHLSPLFTLPVFLNCTRDSGSDLPGCLYKYMIHQMNNVEKGEKVL